MFQSVYPQQPTGYVPVRPMKYVKKIKEPVMPVLCEICNLKLNSTSQAEVHLKGQSHLRAVKKLEGGSFEKNPQNENNLQNNSTSDFNSTIQNIPVIQQSQTVSEKMENGKLSSESDGNEPNQKKTKTITYVYCEVCNAKFNSQAQAEDHFKGLKHLKKSKMMQKPVQNAYNKPNNEELSMNSIARNRNLHSCMVCAVTLNSSQQYEQHCSGHTHRNKVMNFASGNKEMLGNVNGWFYCNSCNISCPTSTALHYHVMTLEHKNNVGLKNPPPENTYINCTYPIPY